MFVSRIASRPRRPLLLSGIVLGALTAALAAPTAARAATDPPGSMATGLYASSKVAGTVSNSCTITGPDGFQYDELTLGRVLKHTLDATRTVTHPNDAADTQTVRAQATVRTLQTRARGSLDRILVNGDFRVSSTAALGADTACQTTFRSRSTFEHHFALAAAGFVEVRLTVTGGAVVEGAIATDPDTSTRSFAFAAVGGPTSSVTRVFLPAGDYVVTGDDGLPGQVPVSGTPTPRTGSSRVALVYTRAGAATTQPQGPGRAYVALKERSCAADTVTTRLSSRAGRSARSVVYFVNGSRRATVSRPTTGRILEVTRLGAARDVTVRAVVRLKNGRAVTVDRSYAACSG
ncbi:hypothetical protein BH11ACT8_BH11ACT8_21350 [soil metagenome]